MHLTRSIGLLVIGIALCSEVAWAQQTGQRGQGQNGQGQNGQRRGNGQDKPEVKLPEDPRLLEIHKSFVLAAEKLAAEYERTNQGDKARACYDEILRLVPTYTPAADKLSTIKMREATADRRTVEVLANKGWQDAGVGLIEGKPVSIRAQGSWVLKMTYSLPPDGIEIPKELRDFPLGALVGKVATSPTDEDGKVFLIGTATSFNAPMDGRLYLRIYDSDPEDNLGKLSATVEGTFRK